MCGICGVVDFSGKVDASALVRRMTSTMVHRGPDDEGFLNDGPLAIGMRRLSIIDLNGGHQPIFNEDGSIAVVLNGEIYNFLELKNTLEGLGHSFRTRSDSEVIAHAYEQWGPECVERLEGMFAIAVYDRRRAKGQEQGAKGQEQRAKSEEQRARGEEQRAKSEEQRAGGQEQRAKGQEQGTLFLARDRLGIKPLYYCVAKSEEQRAKGSGSVETRVGAKSDYAAISKSYVGAKSEEQRAKGSGSVETPCPSPLALGNFFLFASEVRTLLASGVVPRTLSRSSLHSYLLFGSVSEPMTLVEGVLSLPPGHSITINLGSQAQSIQPQPYWNISAASHSNGHNATTDGKVAAARVRELLEESVRLHLIADVPVGVFLSGGIDSTTIAALASRETSDVHTFTVAFAEQKFNEAGIARRTASQFGTRHDELLLSGAELLARLDEAVAGLDQPSMDGINTYFVSWAARQAGLKVALSGLGGDEIFGGYPSTFRWTPRYQQLAAVGDHVPGGVRAAMASALAGAGEALARGDAVRKIAALWDDSHSLPHPYFFARALFTPAQVAKLMSNGESDRSQQSLWWNWLAAGAKEASALDSFAAVTRLEARSYLVNTLLRDTDSMSMAHSLEVRVPFLHHPLVEFVAGLPGGLKAGTDTPKELLVAALADLLPAEVVQQSKRGFTFPWAAWLRGPLREKMERGLSNLSPLLEAVLDERSVYAIWEAYLNGKTSWSRPWSLYVLNEWVKRNLD